MSDGSAEAVRGIWGEKRNGRDICPRPLFSELVGKASHPFFTGDPPCSPRRHLLRRGSSTGKAGWACQVVPQTGELQPEPPPHHSMGPTPLAGKSSSPAEASPSLRLPRSLFLSYSEVYSYSACPTTPNPSVTPSHPAKEVPATKFHWTPSSSLGIDVGLSC